MKVFPGPWTGGNDAGPRDYKPEDRDLVLRVLREHVGPERATTSRWVAAQTGLNGRALRQVFSDVDGREVVLAFSGRASLYVARCGDEAEQMTRRLESQALRMLDRVRRRQEYFMSDRAFRQEALL